jgi:hypothetical protein
MRTFNVNAYGDKLRVNFNEDVSSATVYTMTAQPEVGEELTLTPVALGTVDVYEGQDLLRANQYIEYVTAINDFKDYIGRWRVKGEALLASGRNVSMNYRKFGVSE